MSGISDGHAFFFFFFSVFVHDFFLLLSFLVSIRSFRMLPFFIFLVSLVAGAPWIVTEYYEINEDVMTSSVFGLSTTLVQTITETNIIDVTPAVTASLESALSTTTELRPVDPYYTSSVATIVQVLLPSGAVATPTSTPVSFGLAPTPDSIATSYYVNIGYTAPTSCSSHWTTTSAVPVRVPYQIETLIRPTSVATSLSVDNEYAFQPTTYTIEMFFIAPSQLPGSSLSELSYQNLPTAASLCSYPTASSGGYDSGYGQGNNANWLHDSYWYGISPLAIILITTLGSFGFWFVVGCIESFVQFRDLMRGLPARRGPPRAWCMLAPITSCLVFCFTSKGFYGRPEDEAKELEDKWNAMGAGEKFRLWLKWGFRYKYPPMLGPRPGRVGTLPPVAVSRPRGEEPGVAGVAPLLHASPSRTSEPGHESAAAPDAVAGVVDDGNAAQTGPGPHQEMSQVPHTHE